MPQAVGLDDRLGALEPVTLDFLKGCLACDPSERLSAQDLLCHSYFDPQFKTEFEQELADLLALEAQERQTFIQPKGLSENTTPEPHFLSDKKNTTPRKEYFRSIGTVLMNPEKLIPDKYATHSIRTSHEDSSLSTFPTPPANFLPELKSRHEEEHHYGYHSISPSTFRKKRSEFRIPKPGEQRVKIIDMQNSVMMRKLDTVFESSSEGMQRAGKIAYKSRSISKAALPAQPRTPSEATQAPAISIPMPPSSYVERKQEVQPRRPRLAYAGFVNPGRGRLIPTTTTYGMMRYAKY